MKPIRIFLFILMILLITELYKHRSFFDTKVVGELPELMPVQQLSDDEYLLAETLEVEILDTLPAAITHLSSFFEGADPFDAFEPLMHQLSNKDSMVRIIFMGDSQLEGDFFTHHVRKKLQEHFGGRGIGYMPVETYYNATEGLAIVTNDFDKLLAGDIPFSGALGLGLYGRYFIPRGENSVISINNRNHEHCFSTLKVLCSGRGTLELTDRYGFASSQFVDSDSTIIASFLLETVPRSLNLKVKNEQHFRLEGLLFDPLHGVVVDHVPFRGKLNVKMKEYDSKQFLLQCQLLQPAMVVLQYGLNVVPDVRLEYGNYRIALQQDLQLLKKYLPNASFLVMGVPDMARKEAGIMVSYPNITAVIEAQREAAMREKVAFWNFRKAMGGEGAMVKWVDDGLGRSDYAHLTAAGAEKAATIFVNDLMQVISTLPADD